ncbi:MAG: hypothetical protein JW940_18540 [Polyangiaceae bacterium]|nr:hypothetical protein [Polyangiaceae bacterium]
MGDVLRLSLKVAAGAVFLVGCGAPVFPKELFTVEAQGADYPIMLSETPSKDAGRPIRAESGTHAAVSQSSYSTGSSTVTVTTTEASRSELTAAVKLAAQVRRADRYIQFDKAIFTAVDFSTYGASSADRTLSIEATAHK